ncbi:MAG: 4-(cytidine 5'-diphospho)-2-C-methyl-D-erythritol kinase [Oscillospiraceae bacterium]|jgi:4-diphosphocytidyl-2-C-methyl-D-erythritol kinase|nr:4-(cytidine 5'-diphospho)-2-C-methyl-D-erythritol kinase [Oscillospiraceae bacterium]
MDSLTLRACAKINLHLDITGTLPSGYHALCMLMQTVSLCDEITLTRKQPGITLTCSDPALPTDGRNIAHRAAALFFAETGLDGIAIHIEKRIPFQAGLGGGSADAAAVLRGLCTLFAVEIPPLRLRELALQLGADVPYCLVGSTQLALNTGEVLASLPPLSTRFCVVVKPAVGVSTVGAYKAWDRMNLRLHPDNNALIAAAAGADWDGICAHAANVLEQAVEVPLRAQYKAILREHGAVLAQMTGSGSAIFGIFLDEKSAQKAAYALQQYDARVFVCTTTGEA